MMTRDPANRQSRLEKTLKEKTALNVGLTGVCILVNAKMSVKDYQLNEEVLGVELIIVKKLKNEPATALDLSPIEILQE